MKNTLLIALLSAALLLCPSAALSKINETGPYVCKCKGYQKMFLFIPLPFYGEGCGYGHVGGSQGQINEDIPFSRLPRYVGQENADAVRSGQGCRYLPQSGWNCGKKESGVTPSCLDH